MMEHFHGSPDIVSEIRSEEMFGGIFGGTEETARSHGAILHRIVSPRPLTDHDLNYEIARAWESALEIARGNEAIATRIMSAECPALDQTDSEQGWEFQRLRGRLAARLGYTSVEMRDEHGVTWLCLPGCMIEQL
jgi:hypothetical protein